MYSYLPVLLLWLANTPRQSLNFRYLWGLGTEKEQNCHTGPPGYIGWRNQFLGSLNVYNYGLSIMVMAYPHQWREKAVISSSINENSIPCSWKKCFWFLILCTVVVHCTVTMIAAPLGCSLSCHSCGCFFSSWFRYSWSYCIPCIYSTWC